MRTTIWQVSRCCIHCKTMYRGFSKEPGFGKFTPPKISLPEIKQPHVQEASELFSSINDMEGVDKVSGLWKLEMRAISRWGRAQRRLTWICNLGLGQLRACMSDGHMT